MPVHLHMQPTTTLCMRAAIQANDLAASRLAERYCTTEQTFASGGTETESRIAATRRSGWRWRGKHRNAESDAILRHVADTGPTSFRDIVPQEARGSTGWWYLHPSKPPSEFL